MCNERYLDRGQESDGEPPSIDDVPDKVDTTDADLEPDKGPWIRDIEGKWARITQQNKAEIVEPLTVDARLSAEGLRQTIQARMTLSKFVLPIDYVAASPMRRTTQTARYVFPKADRTNLDVPFEPDWQEPLLPAECAALPTIPTIIWEDARERRTSWSHHFTQAEWDENEQQIVAGKLTETQADVEKRVGRVNATLRDLTVKGKITTVALVSHGSFLRHKHRLMREKPGDPPDRFPCLRNADCLVTAEKVKCFSDGTGGKKPESAAVGSEVAA